MNANFSKTAAVSFQNRTSAFRNPFIEMALLAIVCALLGWFIILPKKAEREGKRRDLAAVEEERDKTADSLAVLRELTQSLQARQEEIKKLDLALPLDGKTINLTLLLNSLARQAGVTAADISISGKGDAVAAGDKILLSDPYAAPRSLQKLSGTVYVIGTFSQLKAFLEKIETSGRLIDIVDLGIDPGPEGNLNLKLTLNAYYFAP